jgi:hypothetical protein
VIEIGVRPAILAILIFFVILSLTHFDAQAWHSPRERFSRPSQFALREFNRKIAS